MTLSNYNRMYLLLLVFGAFTSVTLFSVGGDNRPVVADGAMANVQPRKMFLPETLENFRNAIVRDGVESDPWFNNMIYWETYELQQTVTTKVGQELKLSKKMGERSEIDRLDSLVLANEMPKMIQKTLTKPRNAKKMPILIVYIKAIIDQYNTHIDQKFKVNWGNYQLDSLDNINSFEEVYLLLTPIQFAIVMKEFCRADDEKLTRAVKAHLKKFISEVTEKNESEVDEILAQSFGDEALVCIKNDIKNDPDFQHVKVGGEAKSKDRSMRFIASFVAASLAYFSWAYHGSYDNIGLIFTGIFGMASLYEIYDFVKIGMQRGKIDSYFARVKKKEVEPFTHNFTDDFQWIFHEKYLKEPNF